MVLAHGRRCQRLSSKRAWGWRDGAMEPPLLSRPPTHSGRLSPHKRVWYGGPAARYPASPNRSFRSCTGTASTPPVQVREGHPLARVILCQQVLRQRAEHGLRAQHQAAQHSARARRHHAGLEGAWGRIVKGAGRGSSRG